jgi:hypothetical protein
MKPSIQESEWMRVKVQLNFPDNGNLVDMTEKGTNFEL